MYVVTTFACKKVRYILAWQWSDQKEVQICSICRHRLLHACIDKYGTTYAENVCAPINARANANKRIIRNEHTHRREMCSAERKEEEDAFEKG